MYILRVATALPGSYLNADTEKQYIMMAMQLTAILGHILALPLGMLFLTLAPTPIPLIPALTPTLVLTHAWP